MATFDKRFIDPDEGALTGTLGKAMKAANRENQTLTNLMARDAAFWGRFAHDVLRSGPEGRRRSCRGGRAVPEVIAAWWTDPAGRKHVRIIGRTRHRFARLRREVELRALPPWWHVYPEAVLGVRERDAERYIAVCRCGALGTPESLGWMGDTCGPCFDRRADGGAPAGGFGQFGEWSPHLSRFGFSPDGRQLIGQHLSGAFRTVDRADGTSVVGKRKLGNLVIGMATTKTGAVVALHDGTVYRWQSGTRDLEIVLHSRRIWGRGALAPNGSRLTLLSYQQAFTADLTAAHPQYARRTAFEGFAALRYSPDGSRLLGTTYSGELKTLNVDRGTSDAVRRDAFDGLPGGFAAPTEFALASDGSGALVRRQSFYPSRVLVRHVPLEGGPTVDLKIPDWHQPTNLAYSPDGSYAITAEAESGWIGFWDVSNGKSLGFVRAVLEDLSWRGGQVEFSPGGEALAVAYNTGHSEHGTTIAVWPWPETLRVAG